MPIHMCVLKSIRIEIIKWNQFNRIETFMNRFESNRGYSE